MRDFRKNGIGAKARIGALSSTAAAGALLLALTAASPEAVGQAGSNPPDANNLKICSSVKGAACLNVPGANTPIPKQFQDSYNVYLKMKAAAHGGTQYTRADYAKMPD